MEKMKRFKIKTEPLNLMRYEDLMHRRRIQDRAIKIGSAILLIIGVTLLSLFPLTK